MKHKLLLIFTLFSLTAGAQSNTFLDQAFWKGNPDVAAIQAEIQKGSNPSELNRSGFDPVVLAINAKASTETIRFLLEQKGNDVNKLTHDSRTYIFWSASKGNLEIMDYLLKKGANLKLEDTHGMTPISFAAATGQTDTKVYDLLVKAGANVKQRTAEGASLLLLATPNDKDFALTNYFISKGLSLKDTDAAGNTAFNYAAKTGNIELMKALVEKGVKYTDNAMIMASQGARGGTSNGLAVFQYLESLGIKPSAVNGNGQNVLHNIVRRPNQSELINYFLSKGADVNQADSDGITPFMNATASNSDTATLALLMLGVKNINQVNKKGVSALAMAVRSNTADVVQFLLNKGADMNLSDADGNNLAYYLVQSSAGQSGERQAPGPQKVDQFDLKVKVLQAKGYNLATPQKDGSTLYHLAVAKGDLSLLKQIEKFGVDVNSKNKEGLTPLHKAAMISKDDAALKYLLSIGAKREVTTEYKETAFDLAKENEFLSKNTPSLDFLK